MSCFISAASSITGLLIFSLSTLQILGLMVVRKLLDLMFSQHDLAWLDDILPDKDQKKKEDDKKKKKKEKWGDPESDEEVRGMST